MNAVVKQIADKRPEMAIHPEARRSQFFHDLVASPTMHSFTTQKCIGIQALIAQSHRTQVKIRPRYLKKARCRQASQSARWSEQVNTTRFTDRCGLDQRSRLPIMVTTMEANS